MSSTRTQQPETFRLFSLLEPNYDESSEEDPQDVQFGDQFMGQRRERRHVEPELAEDHAHLDLRRARRLLRPRAAARRRFLQTTCRRN